MLQCLQRVARAHQLPLRNLQRRTFFSVKPPVRKTGRSIELADVSQETMFSVIRAVENYHRFLPYCTASQIHSEAGGRDATGSFVGTLTIAYGGVFEESYSSKVTFDTPVSVRSEALNSASFPYLVSDWSVQAMDSEGCEVTCSLEFQAQNKLLDAMLKDSTEKILNKQLDAFVARARKEQLRQTQSGATSAADLSKSNMDVWDRAQREAEASTWQPG